MADGTELAALVLAAEGMRSILKDDDIMLLCQLHNGIHINRIAANMHRHDHLRLVGNLPGHVFRVHIKRQRVNVGKDNLTADGQRIRHRGSKGDRRHNDFIAGFETGVFARNLEASGAVGQKCTALGAEILVAHLLGLGDLFVKRQLRRRLRHLVQRVDFLLDRFQRSVIRLAAADHHELDDGHQVFCIVILTDRSPGDLGLAGVISKIRRFLFCFVCCLSYLRRPRALMMAR